MSVDSNIDMAYPGQETTAELRRVLTGMQDSLTDEMISRIASTVSDSAQLMDQIGRSGIDKAIPTIAGLVENGDLERIAQLLRVLGAAQDAITDEMVERLMDMVSRAMTLIDRLSGTDLDKLIAVLPRITALVERLEEHNIIDDLVDSLNVATTQVESNPPACGGIAGMWKMMRDPETQESIRFLLLVSRQFLSCRTKRQAALTTKL